jgi:hypothetical protein
MKTTHSPVLTECKIVALHGAMVGVKGPYKSKKKLDEQLIDGMCKMFHNEIASSDPYVHLFKWMSDHPDSEILNPLAGLSTYIKERELISGVKLQNRLYSELSRYTPMVVIAHSMGCHLLLNTINNNGLPDSIKYIVTINSDAPDDLDVTNTRVQKRLENGSLTWINLYANDPTLASSVIINAGKMRAGLFGTKSKLAINKPIAIHGNHNFGFQSPVIREMIINMTRPGFDISDWEDKIK